MVKKRPRIRFDGFYIMKHHYVRYGESECSEYRPSWDVYSYRYLRFYKNGKFVLIHSVNPPKKFAKKLYGQLENMIKLVETEIYPKRE